MPLTSTEWSYWAGFIFWSTAPAPIQVVVSTLPVSKFGNSGLPALIARAKLRSNRYTISV